MRRNKKKIIGARVLQTCRSYGAWHLSFAAVRSRDSICIRTDGQNKLQRMPNTYSQIYIQIVFAVEGPAMSHSARTQGRTPKVHNRNRDRPAPKAFSDQLHARPHAHFYWAEPGYCVVRPGRRHKNRV